MKRIIIFFINWFIIITMPIWGGSAMFIASLYEMFLKRNRVATAIAKGEKTVFDDGV